MGLGTQNASVIFENTFVNMITEHKTFGLGTDGLLMNYMRKVVETEGSLPFRQLIRLHVAEVSYCEIQENCNPQTSGLTPVTPLPDGVHAYLYFEFWGGRDPEINRQRRW